MDEKYKIFVGNLNYDMTDDDLQREFSKFGQIQHVAVIYDKERERSKGYGFITYEEEQSVEDAIQEMNGQVVKDRELTVNKAKPRGGGGMDRGYGGGGNRGYGGGNRGYNDGGNRGYGGGNRGYNDGGGNRGYGGGNRGYNDGGNRGYGGGNRGYNDDGYSGGRGDRDYQQQRGGDRDYNNRGGGGGYNNRGRNDYNEGGY